MSWRAIAITALIYFAVMDGFVFLLTGESGSHALLTKGPNERIGSKAHLERQDREEYERLQRLKAKFERRPA